MIVSVELVSGIPVSLSFLLDFYRFSGIKLVIFNLKMVAASLFNILILNKFLDVFVLVLIFMCERNLTLRLILVRSLGLPEFDIPAILIFLI